MMIDEELELDEVAGDFVDWFNERIHYLCVRQAKHHRACVLMFNSLKQMHYEHDIKLLFGHDKSFYE